MPPGLWSRHPGRREAAFTEGDAFTGSGGRDVDLLGEGHYSVHPTGNIPAATGLGNVTPSQSLCP